MAYCSNCGAQVPEGSAFSMQFERRRAACLRTTAPDIVFVFSGI